MAELKLSDLSIPTYKAGLLQAQAYRALKQFLSGYLGKHNLVMNEWALLGLLNEGGPMRLSALAKTLQVEPSLSTTMVNKLHKQGLVKRLNDPADSRAKQVMLTAKGGKLVDSVESDLRKEMKEYLQDISPAELILYINVLSKLASKAI
jgi:MarR family transcriptional regulator, transcriptional regulator for hemolysin